MLQRFSKQGHNHDVPKQGDATMRKHLSLTAGVAIANLLRETIVEYPPAGYRFTLPASTGGLRLGHYLLSLGYITPRQLINALAEQRQAAQQGTSLMLGEVLVQAQIIHPRVLTTVLLLQLVDRLLDPDWTPQFLGEQLVADGVLGLSELAPALQLQIWLRQSGAAVPLGDLLVQQDRLTHQRLADALAAQQHRLLQIKAKTPSEATASREADDILDAAPGIRQG
jgi:hypothetical protein